MTHTPRSYTYISDISYMVFTYDEPLMIVLTGQYGQNIFLTT
jgi:hypothetical protein